MRGVKFLCGSSLLVVAIALSLMGCLAADAGPSWEAKSQAIIGGEEESGYPEVGSLLYRRFLETRSQCTATLIDPEWLLTAAHCLKDGIGNLSFAIGRDAPRGTRYELAEAFVHPRYDSNPIGSLFDIALVRLDSPIPASVATPRPYNRAALEPYLGASNLYIGYGSTSGTSPFLGLGRKRRVELPIDRIDPTTYSHGFDGKGLCFGDSGGPGLLEIDGALTVVGVTSAAYGCQGDTCEPCSNGSKHTRVDRFADWIASIIGDDYPGCEAQPERCACAAACGADGVCDDAMCGADSCADITDCLFGECADSPDGACSTACIDDGSIAARAQLRVLVDCWAEECRGIVGSANERQCLIDNCGESWSACQAQVEPEPGPEPEPEPEPEPGPEPEPEPEPGADPDPGPDGGETRDAGDTVGGCQAGAGGPPLGAPLLFVVGGLLALRRRRYEVTRRARHI